MKKGLRYLLSGLVIASLNVLVLKAQPTLDYIRGIGGVNSDMGAGVAADNSGNVFTTGIFSGTSVNFNPGGTTIGLSSNTAPSSDFYIGKYSATGVTATTDVFEAGASSNDVANRIYVDASGNAYVVGNIFGTPIYFDKNKTVTGFLNGSSGKGYIAKYNNTLDIQWSMGIGPNGSSNSADVKDIAVDASGNIYVTGQFQGTVNFNPPTSPVGTTGAAINLTASGLDVFVAMYNSSGNAQWAINLGGSNSDVGLGIDYDNSGNVYVTGVFRGQKIDFNPSTLPADTAFLYESSGGSTSGDIFVAKYSSTGTYVNAFNIGNALADQATGIAVDHTSGDFAISGYFQHDVIAIDFDPGVGTQNAIAAGTSGSDLFVAKYSSAFAYQWHKVVGSTGSERANQVRLSGANLFVTGTYQGSATDFGDTHPLTSAGGYDAFMAGYTFSSGTCLFASSLGGAGDEEGTSIAYKGSKLYVTGYYTGSGDYDPSAGGVTTLTNAGSNDVFLGQYTYTLCTMPAITTQPASISACAGTAASFSVVATGATSYQWKHGATNVGTSSASYPIASVAVADAGNYTVDVINSCGTVTSSPAAVLTVYTPVTASASSTSAVCSTPGTVTLTGNDPTPGTGAWTVTGGTATFGNSTSNATTATVTSGTSLVFKWTTTNGACITNATSTTTVTSPVTASASSTSAVCSTPGTVTLTGNDPTPGTGAWTVTGGTATFGNSTSNATTATVTSGTSLVFKWTTTNGACITNATSTTTVSSPVTASASSTANVCSTPGTVTLTGNAPSPGTGAWTVTGGTATFGNSTSNSTTATVTSGTSLVFKWTTTNGACITNATSTTTVSSPVTASASSTANVCSTPGTVTLTGNDPTPGTGAWTVTGGGATFGNSTSNSTTATVTSGTSLVFKWTTTNGACVTNATSTTTVSSPVTASASSTSAVCSTPGTVTLTGNDPTPGTGAWTVTGGGATFGNSTSNSTTATVTSGTSLVFKWTTTNGACVTNATSTTTVSSPVTANASSTSAVCSTPGTVTLTGNDPSPGTGAWTVTGGTATFGNSTSNATTATVTSGTSLVFKWTTTNGACITNATSTTTVTSPVTASASSTSAVCSTPGTVTLTGNDPTPGTGAWTVTGGTATFGNSTSNSTTATVTSGTSLVFKWTTTNGACITNATSTTTVSSPVTASASSTSAVCSTPGTVTLTGNDPTPGTGAWTVTGGTATFGNSTSNSTTATVTSGTSLVFKWTTTNGACITNATSTTTVTSPVTASASSTANVCSTPGTVTLTGNDPTPGTGAWTVTGGTATFGNSTSNSTTATVISGTSLVFKWTTTNGACITNATSTTTVSSPVTASASSTANVCSTPGTVTLTGNDPTPGTGAWTVTGGTATFGNSTSNSTTAAVTSGTSLVFKWTTTNGACITNATSTTTVSSPVTANAGSNLSLCNTTTATLAGSNPSPGAGTWTTTSGTGTATTPSNSASGVTGLTVGASSTFLWTVTNGACVSSSSVTVTSYSPVTANAGATQSLCNVTTATLAGNNPAPGTGTWTTTSGTGVITTPSSPTSGISGLTVGASSVFKWTVTNGACTANASVTVTSSSPVTADAGSDQALCNVTTTTLAATGTGTWTKTLGTGTVTTPSSATSGVTGLTKGASSTFRWTVTNGACTDFSDVVIDVSLPGSTSAGADQLLCNTTTTTLSASGGTGSWTTLSGTGVVTSVSNPTTGVTGLTVGAATTFQWTATTGACSGSASVTVTVSAPPTGNAGADQNLCNATTSTLSATGSGTWTTTNGSGIVTTPGSPNSGVTGLTLGSASVFTWTVVNGACSSTSTTTITSLSSVSITTQPVASSTLCTGNTYNLGVSATGSGTLTYQWKVGSSNANGASTGSTYSIPSVVFGDAGNYTVDVTNSCGTVTSNIAQLVIQNLAITTQPVSQVVCPGVSTSFNVVATGPSISYQWKKDNADIVGQQSSSLALNSVSASDVASYTVLISGCSNSILSDPATLGLSVCTGTVDETSNNRFRIYPNPTSSSIYLNGFGQDPIKSLMIVDVNGDVVYQEGNMSAASHELAVGAFAPGLYHIILFTSSGTKWVEKVEVAK